MGKADEALDKWLDNEFAECARLLIIGAAVYRPDGEKVEKGTIVRIDRVRINSVGESIEDPKGDHLSYVANFGPGKYERQTYRWKFFDTEAAAWKKVSENMLDRANQSRILANKYDKIAAEALIKSQG